MTEFLGNVLFLCTGNSARSILAEVLLTTLSQGAFKGFSAGSHPRGEVHPVAIETLRRHGLPTEGLRSKSWDEFAQPRAPEMHFILTVCDQAAGEVCPIWPGRPIEAHWGIPDPVAVKGGLEQVKAFGEALNILQLRIQFFMSFRIKEMKRSEVKKKLDEAGTLTMMSRASQDA